MLKVWSNNKTVNIVVDLLLYFMAMNIFHYGQFLLPIICLILFVDNKFVFKLNNIKTFVVLCLFALSFFIFSYKQGLYSVMGFCLPMGYYIGSNIKSNNCDAIKKVIYILALGMITHYLLNFIYELSLFGWHRTVSKSTRYDIWLQGPFVSTGTATNSVILISIIYYLLFKEKNKYYKLMGIILFIPTVFYTFILRRRTQIGILFIVFILSYVIDLFVFKNEKQKKIIKRVLFFFIFVCILLIIMYFTNLLGFKNYVVNNSVIAFTIRDGLSSGRFDIFLSGIKYIPTYLWGGQYISSINGDPFHDLLLNIYDYAGLIPFLLMIAYLIISAISIIKILKNKTINNDYKLFIIEITVGYIIMFFLEPLMTGSSIFLIIGILIMSSFELLV